MTFKERANHIDDFSYHINKINLYKVVKTN